MTHFQKCNFILAWPRESKFAIQLVLYHVVTNGQTAPEIKELLINLIVIQNGVLKFFEIIFFADIQLIYDKATKPQFIFRQSSSFIAEDMVDSCEIFKHQKIFDFAAPRLSVGDRFIHVIHLAVVLKYGHVHHFCKDHGDSQIQGNHNVEQQVKGEE